MSVLHIHDRAQEFRVEIRGKFAGSLVSDTAMAWTRALREKLERRFTVDISGLTGFDTLGKELLSDMCRHGTDFAAGTPASLGFLSQISAAPGNISRQRPVKLARLAPPFVALATGTGD
jgi:hypothetical protein